MAVQKNWWDVLDDYVGVGVYSEGKHVEFMKQVDFILGFLKEHHAKIDANMNEPGQIDLVKLGDTLVELENKFYDEFDDALLNLEDRELKDDLRNAIQDLFYYMQAGTKRVSEFSEVKTHSSLAKVEVIRGSFVFVFARSFGVI